MKKTLKHIAARLERGYRFVRDFGGITSPGFVEYVFQRLAVPTLGTIYVSDPVQKMRRWLGRQRGKSIEVGSLRIAVVTHVFYPDVLPEILACRSVLSEAVPLFITVPEGKRNQVEELLPTHANAHLLDVANRGRDIAPFIALLRSGVLDEFDAVLKIHTKRSTHLRQGQVRRRLLLMQLCGERAATLRILRYFEDATTGMVGWRASFRIARPYLKANQPMMRQLAKQMKAVEHLRLGFFEGSMFWFRPSSLAPLRSLDLKAGDFEPETGQVDGTLAHAIERCFTIACWKSRMRVLDTSGEVLIGSLLESWHREGEPFG